MSNKSIDTIMAWLEIAKYLEAAEGRKLDKDSFADHANRIAQENGPPSLIGAALANAMDQEHFVVDFDELARISQKRPVIAWSKDGRPFLITGRTIRRRYRVVHFVGNGETVQSTLTQAELRMQYDDGVQFEDRLVLDVWDKDPAEARTKRWFWDAIKPLLGASRYLVLAAVVGNTLAVAISLFALQVWDRVVPAQSMNTLTVLMIGVGCAMIFELSLRLLRASLIDEVGGEVDQEISSTVFAQMLGLRADARPSSLGALAAQLREINQLRDAVSSTVLNAAIDLPFTIVFLFAIFLIAPPLILPIIAGIVIILVLCVLAQFPLSQLAVAGLEEASVRNGLIVESVMKTEELKLQQAEQTMLVRWNKVIATGIEVGKSQRRWRNLLVNGTQFIQQGAYVMVVSYGALLMIDGSLSMGQVIACSILTNRAIAPMGQVSSVMSALQGSIIAKRSIDELMARQTDLPTKDHLRRSLKAPAYIFRNVRYTYPGTESGGLVLPRLDIPYGAKIGLLGRVGAGKSTLLRVLSGLVQPTQGTISFDNADIAAIHPGDLRRAIGFQSQSAALLRGTVRDNLLIAKPSATEEEMIHACTVSGATNLLTANSRGLDLMINEAGEGLSGGQRQSLLLARMILRNSPVALFDEPTASMDQQSEAGFIEAIGKWGATKTLIIATHRTPPLQLCDRLMLIDEGRITLDGPRDEVLDQLRGKGKPS